MARCVFSPPRFGEGLGERLTHRLALAGVAVSLVVGLLAWNATRESSALALAFDAVAAATEGRGWRSWQFRSVSRDGTRTVSWVRLPDAFRSETRVHGVLTELKVQRGGESWIYLPARRAAVHGHTRIMDLARYPTPLKELRRLHERAREVGGLWAKSATRRDSDGREVRIIRVAYERAKYGYDPSAGKLRRFTFTLDARTGRLLRWEYPDEGFRAETVAWDRPLPERLFAWQPSRHVRVVEVGDWWGERLRRTVAAARNRVWEVIVHAVDVAANRDVWVTASWRRRSGGPGAPETIPFDRRLSDDHGRSYVLFGGYTRGPDQPGRTLLGYTPVQPMRPGDPPPRRLYAHVLPESQVLTGVRGSRTHGSAVELPALPPSTWVIPGVSPMSVATDLQTEEEAERRREAARRAFTQAKD